MTIAQDNGNTNFQLIANTLTQADLDLIYAKLDAADRITIAANKTNGTNLNANNVTKTDFLAEASIFIDLTNVNITVTRVAKLLD